MLGDGPMQKILKSLRRIKLVLHRSSPMLKLLLLCVVLCATLALLTLQGVILETQAENADLMTRIQSLEGANEDLEQSIAELGTVQGVERIAQEELGLVDPDTVIITPRQ